MHESRHIEMDESRDSSLVGELLRRWHRPVCRTRIKLYRRHHASYEQNVNKNHSFLLLSSFPLSSLLFFEASFFSSFFLFFHFKKKEREREKRRREKEKEEEREMHQ